MKLVNKMHVVDGIMGINFNDQFSPKPISSPTSLNYEAADLFVELDLLDAAENTRFRVFGQKIKFEGHRSCDLLVSKHIDTQNVETFGNKVCGKFEVEVPAPHCYEFSKAKWIDVQDDATKGEYIVDKT